MKKPFAHHPTLPFGSGHVGAGLTFRRFITPLPYGLILFEPFQPADLPSPAKNRLHCFLVPLAQPFFMNDL
jgi:hypothetical protein